ncbi:hypothetical protein EAF00_010280 [Botryotinia globosa]|nr:hypothetical protein EAF00_010280 [Botryotinia globosa]
MAFQSPRNLVDNERFLIIFGTLNTWTGILHKHQAIYNFQALYPTEQESWNHYNISDEELFRCSEFSYKHSYSDMRVKEKTLRLLRFYETESWKTKSTTLASPSEHRKRDRPSISSPSDIDL